MSLDGTFLGLQASIADFLNRTDLATSIPDFITLAEAQMNLEIRCRDMWFVKTLVLTAETLKLPCDLVSVKSFRLNVTTNGDEGKLTYRTPEQMDDLPIGIYGPPRHYTVAGGCFVFWPIPTPPVAPAPALTARLRAVEAIPPLSTGNPSNWLLSKYPQAYLYGALAQSAPYLHDDDRLTVWGGLFTDAVAKINQADQGLIADSLQTVSTVGDGHRYRRGYANP